MRNVFISIGLILGLAVILIGCSGSEANPFLGKWSVDSGKTKEVNKAMLEKDEVATNMLMAILSEIKLEVTEESATMAFADKAETGKYTIKNNTMTLQMNEEKFIYEMLEDKKTISMVDQTAKEGELKTIILTKEEN